MDSPRHPRFGELSALSSSISCIVPGAKCIDMLVDEPGVQACRFTTGQDSGVLKRWPAHRVAKAGPQVGAEFRAAAVFGAVLDEPSPLMALTLQQSADPRGSTFSVYPYAGPSAEHMLDTCWVHLTRQQREPLCKKLAICGLKVIQMLENVPAEFGGPKLHRDGKLANWCYNQAGDFFVCIDFGGFCSTSSADWFGIVDVRYIDSNFGLVIDGPGASTSPAVRVLDSVDHWRFSTTPSLDLYLLALAVIELYLGRLPAAIDYAKYGPEHMEEYLAVVCDYQWPDCVELADAPWEMMDFVLWCMERNPANRPTTAAEALQHEWLADQVAAVEEAVAEAAPAWAATHNRLRGALAGWHASPAQAAAPADSSNASSSSSSEASRCSPADCTADSSEQLLPGNSSNGSSSSMACSTPLAASDPAGDTAPSPVSSCSEAPLLLAGDSSASSPDSCRNAGYRQQDVAALADDSNSSEASSAAGCSADSSEQLRPGHSSSSGDGSSKMACSTPVATADPVGDAAASPVSSSSRAVLLLDGDSSISSSERCSDASSNSHAASSCSPAGSTSVSSSGQLCLGYGSGGSGSSTVCTKPSQAKASTEKAGNEAASSVSRTSKALLLSPSGSGTCSPEYCSHTACSQQDPAAPADSSNASSSSSEASRCSPADCTADSSSEQLRPAYSSSGGSNACMHPLASSDWARDTAPNPVSSTSKASLLLDDDSSTSSPECRSNAERQQRVTVAPADDSTVNSNSGHVGSSCSPDGCTAVVSLGQLRRGPGSSCSGCSTVCTTSSAASETVRDQASPLSSASEASLLSDGDSSATSSTTTSAECCITAACQQLDLAAPVECSNASPGYAAVISPEQVGLGHSSSGGGSTNFTNPLTASDPAGDAAANSISDAIKALLLLDGNRSTSSSKCCSNAASQQQDAAAPIYCSNADCSNDDPDSCTTAGCSAIISSGQRRLVFSSGGGIMVCTTPLVASDNTWVLGPAQQLWPPLSESSNITYSTAFQASGAMQHQTASSSQASSSRSTCSMPSAALVAVPHLTATSKGTSSNGGCGEQLHCCYRCRSRQRCLCRTLYSGTTPTTLASGCCVT